MMSTTASALSVVSLWLILLLSLSSILYRTTTTSFRRIKLSRRHLQESIVVAQAHQNYTTVTTATSNSKRRSLMDGFQVVGVRNPALLNGNAIGKHYEAGMKAPVSPVDCFPQDCDEDLNSNKCDYSLTNNQLRDFRITNAQVNNVIGSSTPIVVRLISGTINLAYSIPPLSHSRTHHPFHVEYGASGNYCIHIFVINGRTGEERAYLHKIPGAVIPIRPSPDELPDFIYVEGSDAEDIVIQTVVADDE